jgi:hypothetical protein
MSEVDSDKMYMVSHRAMTKKKAENNSEKVVNGTTRNDTFKNVYLKQKK